MNGARYLTGWALVRVAGAEPERFLQALAERGIVFWDASAPADYTLTVKVPDRAARHMAPLAAGLGCEAAVVSRHGLPALARRLVRRPGLWAALLGVLAVLYVGSAFVWDITLEGNDTIPDRVILQALRTCGVDIGAYWPAFSQDAIRNGVILRVPGIRWMTVTVRGGHARVIIRQTRERLPPVDESEYVHIVAEKAGLVEQVSALRGTAEVEARMAVLPGEVLIGGYSTGRGGVQGPVRAMGGVTARTWYELTAQAPLEDCEKVPVERGYSRWALILGKTRLNFYKDSSICPIGCDKIIECHTFGLPGLFTLPFRLERTVFVPYETETVQAMARREQLEEQLMASLLSQVGPEGEVLASTFSAARSGETIRVTLRAECREQIGAERPLTEAELAEIERKIPKTEDR